MIKSTKTSLKFSNQSKLEKLNDFIAEYKSVMKQFIDLLWEEKSIPKRLPKNLTDQISSWLSARAIQCAGKQASGIVRGTKTKQRKRLFIYNKLVEEGKFKKARKLKRIIDSATVSKPEINNVNPELDSRFIHQDWENKTTYDGIITISSLGNHLKIALPVKKTKHFNQLLSKGKLKLGVRISNSNITFMFELPTPSLKSQGSILGLDIGIKNSFTLSNGISSQIDNHGHSLETINHKLARKTKGSKAFLKAQQHRTNYINWSLNQIDFANIKTLKIEEIKNLRKFSRTSRYLSHFTYTEIFGKLETLCENNGVQLIRINPTYTSQRCSKCGWVRSSNRKGKLFKCKACGYEQDADLNASINIATDLRPIGRAERLLHKNKKGFYWNEVGEELIVPSAQKPNLDICPSN